jgi:hypothetical protein
MLCLHMIATPADLSTGILWDNGPFVTHVGHGFLDTNISRYGRETWGGVPDIGGTIVFWRCHDLPHVFP